MYRVRYYVIAMGQIGLGGVDLRTEYITHKHNMAKKLYVGGIAWTTTDDSLKQAFSAAGAVENAFIVMDKFTGRSKGFGFVEMADDAGATAAIAMWNGKDLDGRTLVVNEARPMEERPAGSRPPRRDFGNSNGGGRDYGNQGGAPQSGNRW